MFEAEFRAAIEACVERGHLQPWFGEKVTQLLDVAAAAGEVTKLYPTIAGTSILIKNANVHVERDPWADVADAVYSLILTLQELQQ